MVLWDKVDFSVLIRELLPTFKRKPKFLALFDTFISALIRIYNETFYTLQHDGRKIYLEKVLNDYYNIEGYNPSQHDETKKIYITNVAQIQEVFIYQPLENNPVFLGDSSNTIQVFINQEDETLNEYSFTIFIPDTVVFDEQDLRAEFGKYEYIGRLYNIETYTI
ncbi:hypothetical protein [Flavobacterium sp. N1994]|uniref:hypothetical protein n=1 Tax=Flavobacterium sp. N1994 TaxID=2986827 RepID=UPI002221ED07|nr:hypothetical protein [Flavobacterium sp. N1994]